MVLQAFAALATVAIGAYLAPRLRDDPVAMAGILGFVVIALFQVVGAAASARPSVGGGETPRQDREDAFDHVMEHVVDAVKLFLSIQREYQTNLSGLNKRLSPSATRAAVQDVIIELMNRNMEMQGKVNDLSRQLEAARQQIVSLRDNVAEVGKIALTDALTELGNRRFSIKHWLPRLRALTRTAPNFVSLSPTSTISKPSTIGSVTPSAISSCTNLESFWRNAPKTR